MARSIDTASLSFGLVSIPVKVYSTTERSHEVHFHLLHAGCGERLKQQYVCPSHGMIEREDMAKGYEVHRGSYIELSQQEIDALDAVGTGAVEIREFVPATAVDPIFIERSYYLGPDRGGARAYRLLRDALAAAELVAIASFAARGNSYVVMVRPFHDGLAMHQLRYADEVKPWHDIELGELPRPTASELSLAHDLIAQLRHTRFDPKAYTDEVKQRVRDLLARKAKSGEAIVAAEATSPPPITDLMAALRASLGGGAAHAGHAKANGKQRAARRVRARPQRQPARAHRPSLVRSRS